MLNLDAKSLNSFVGFIRLLSILILRIKVHNFIKMLFVRRTIEHLASW